MRVGVIDARKDGVLFEQCIEPAQIHAHCKDQQQKSKRNRKPAPRQRDGASPPARENPGASGDQNKEDSHDAANYGERQQPARKELPYRKREQIKVQWLAKDRIENAAARVRGAYQ